MLRTWLRLVLHFSPPFIFLWLLFILATISSADASLFRPAGAQRAPAVDRDFWQKVKERLPKRYIHLKSRKSFTASEVMGQYSAQEIKEDMEEDQHFHIAIEPGDASTSKDPYYDQLWSLKSAQGGLYMGDAWEETTGSASIVVAVLDTGIRPHQDLNGRILPGHDMISNPSYANDGGGRDSDASDPGDWIASGDICYFGTSSASSWHGTHVAGTIGANGGNGLGVTGIDWKARILPVRVLGKCGGLTSDIADGIRWAAGGSVSGVPNNPNPARVINLSLGGEGACGTTMQAAIDFALSKNAVVVVAAGNSSADAKDYAPANCRGVITVGATTKSAVQAYYSNYGSIVDISAPGGDGMSQHILSLSNSGSAGPVSDSYKAMSGTSMATPHVSGVAALMLAVNPGLYPAQIKQIMKDSAQPFAAFSSCASSGKCGVGILQAAAAVMEASVAEPDPSIVDDKPVPVTAPVSNTSSVTPLQREEGGGACGTVDMGGPSGGDGGSGGMFMLNLIFGLGLACMLKLSRRQRALAYAFKA